MASSIILRYESFRYFTNVSLLHCDLSMQLFLSYVYGDTSFFGLFVTQMDLSFHRKHNPFTLQNRSTTMRPNMVAKSSGEEYLQNSMAPFQPRSETGLFLSQLLHTNPDLVPSAVEHELERLSGNRKAESCQSNISSASAYDKDLYRSVYSKSRVRPKKIGSGFRIHGACIFL